MQIPCFVSSFQACMIGFWLDYIQLVSFLVIVSCSPCPCNSEVHSQNEAIALKYLENLTFTK